MESNDAIQKLVTAAEEAEKAKEIENFKANQDQLFNKGGKAEQYAAQILANNGLPATSENLAVLYTDKDFQAQMYDTLNLSPTSARSESLNKTKNYYTNKLKQFEESASNAKSQEEREKYLKLVNITMDKVNTFKAKQFEVERHVAKHRQKIKQEIAEGKWRDNGDGTYSRVYNSLIEKITDGAIVPEAKIEEEKINGNILKSATDKQLRAALNDFIFNTVNASPLYHRQNTGFRFGNKPTELYKGEDILGASGQANIIKSLIDKKNNTKDATMSDKDIRDQVQEAMKDTNIQALARLAIRQNLVKSSEDFINLLFHNPTFVEANIWGKAFGDYKNYGIGYKFMSKGVNDLINGENSEEADYIANLFFDNSPQGRADLGATLKAFKR